MPPLVASDRGIPKDGSTIDLQPGGPNVLRSAHISPKRFVLAFNRRGSLAPVILGHFLLFFPLLEAYFAFLQNLIGPFLFHLGKWLQSEIVRNLKRRRRKRKVSWDMGWDLGLIGLL